MGNHNWHPDAVRILAGWLPEWLKDNPDVDFMAIGDLELGDKLGIPRPHLRDRPRRLAKPVFDFPDLPRVLPEIDIGLVPLELSTFNEAKSCLKGLEYGACGIPFVASSTGEYVRLVAEAPVGLLADTPEEWRHALDLLVSDKETRRVMGANGRIIAERFSVERDWRLWESAYLDVLDQAKAA
jgi:glycosyltransferase involved in cell wall biosynthesis